MSQNNPQDNFQRTGRGMLLLTWLSVLMFLFWLFQLFIDEQNHPNRDLEMVVNADGVREVVLQRNVQGHYLADGSINGRVVTFLLDTGATDVALTEDLAQRLDLPRLQSGFSQTAAGPVSVWRTRLERIQIGSLEMRDVRATVVPSMGEGSPVLLGMSFLKHLEMVQRDGRLTLRQGG